MSARPVLLLLLALLLLACGAEPPTEPRGAPSVTVASPTLTTAPTATRPAPTERPTTTATIVAPPEGTATPRAEARAAFPTYEPARRAARPVALRIPRIGVDTTVESVGLDDEGRMAVPERVANVSWFQFGAEPMNPGNAVVSGHLDDFQQQPAVFWRLHELEPGDEVLVEDADGTTHRFEVLGSQRYAADEAPIEVIFGFTTDRNLNLITCDGAWDAQARSYDERLVVFTRAADD